MHSVLLSLLLVAGANPQAVPVEQQSFSADQTGGCATCGAAVGRCGHGCAVKSAVRGVSDYAWDWFGPMPQTCYQPRFGCYPGNSRDIHRYPAFHGTYYREPYNYRNYFDYPWHAQPFEPLGYFSYQPKTGAKLEEGVPTEAPVPPDVSSRPVPAPPVATRPSGAVQSGWKTARQRTAPN